MSWSCGPLRPRSRSRSLDLGLLIGGGGTKIEANLVTLMGSAVSAGGSGSDSIRVTLSRGRVANIDVGRSIGEQATRTCRK
jgi:hypothetical protein